MIFFFGYFIPREEFVLSISLFGFSFLFYYLICFDGRFWKFSISRGFLFAFILRMVLILSIPALSDDFYRYIFDGQLIKMGLNPYLLTPSELMNSMGTFENSFLVMLYAKMNSPEYFSIYPPLHQIFFFVASLGGENLIMNILILRIIIIAFDFLNMFLIYKILIQLDQPIYKVWLYAFNPLVILELTGNLHFEGLVLSGILCLIYFWTKKKPGLSALSWSFSIGIKLTPLMLGPFLLVSQKKDKVLQFILLSAISISVFLIPLFVSNGIENFWQSFRLFQSTFEFNASLYYLIRWLSGFFIDYNPIASVGPALNFAALVSILFYSLKFKGEDYKKVCIGIVHIYLIYLLTQNVVHPWYIIPAFGVSLLTRSKIFLVWTGLVFLSYFAYSNQDFKESPILLILEYSVLFIFILVEIFFKGRHIEVNQKI